MNRRMKAFRGDAETIEDMLVESQHEIKTPVSGYLNVFVKGDWQNIRSTTAVFLTIHDLGTNHEDFHKLMEHPCMAKVKQHSVWIHVDMPGQEYDAVDLPPYFEFPTLDQMCEDLEEVLDYFEIEHCITFGEGAGANILVRFAMKFPEKVLGNILIHCDPNVESIKYFFMEKIMSWRLKTFGMNKSTDQYLAHHKFGLYKYDKGDLDAEQAVKDYLEQLNRKINPKNLKKFVDAYVNRSDIQSDIKKKLDVKTLIICGSTRSQKRKADQMQSLMDSELVTRVDLDECPAVMDQAPDLIINNLILFCQGLGLLSALPVANPNTFSWN